MATSESDDTDVPIPGGFTNGIDSEKLEELKEIIAKKVNEESDSQYHQMFFKLLKAQKQVVAGVNYKLQIAFADSTCTKEQIKNNLVSLNDCKLAAEPNENVYEVEVWEQVWLDKQEITKFKQL